jgi:hypothetical protein
MSDDVHRTGEHFHFTSIGKHVGYDDALREYYIVVSNHAGVAERQALLFCPICGDSFPKSLRGEWFDRLEARGIDPLNEEVPVEYRDGTWWRQEGH